MTKSFRTKWNLEKLYKNINQVDKDVEKIDKAYTSFAKKYKGKDFTSSASKLMDALKNYEALQDVFPSKPSFYLSLANALNTGDQEIESKLNLVSQKLSKIANKVVFFTLDIGKIPKDKQRKYLESKRLEKYNYLLERIFEEAKYDLSESEEKILNLKSLPSSTMWYRGVQKALNKLEIEHGNENLGFSQAIEMLSNDMDLKERRVIWGKIKDEFKKLYNFSESELNAIVTDQKISDELRGYAKSYTATIRGYENTEEEVLNLVETVEENFRISHNYFSLKKEILGIDKMEYVDRFAGPEGAVERDYKHEKAINILRETFNGADQEFGKILERLLDGGQIDFFPKKGKRSGAFCAGEVNLPTYVLLNHTDDLNSLSTFAHEMGHAIHTEMSKTQPEIYQDYTTSVAEVASTFFENIVFYSIYETLTDREKVIALSNKLDSTIATVFRQTSFFNFEREMHETIRKSGSMSHEDLAELLQEHLKSYMGKAVNVDIRDGYSYIYVSHFRYGFYVYSYVYGELISQALYKKYKEDNNYIEEIKKFLSAGGSKSPYKIFKDIGIDTRDKSFWKEGLDEISRQIKELKELTSK